MHGRDAIQCASKQERAKYEAEGDRVRVRVSLIAESVPCESVAEIVHQAAGNRPGMPRHKARRVIPRRRLSRVRKILGSAEVIVNDIPSGKKLMFFREIEIKPRNVRVPVFS